MTVFHVNELLTAARKETGLQDFGPDDFRHGLEALVENINNREDVLPDRIDMLRGEILRLLANRLWFAKDVAEHPEILEQELLPPVIIPSPPRTGTTKVQRLLSLNDRLASPLYWQIHMSSRIPGLPDGGREARLEKTEKFVQWQNEVLPELEKIHKFTADQPEEELLMTDETFRSNYLAVVHGSNEYSAWIAQTNLDASYDYLVSQFKYLQWQFYRESPRRWLLKAPGHLSYEDQLLRVFPSGQQMIFTHRAPETFVASMSNFLLMLPKKFYRGVDAKTVGELVLGLTFQPLLDHMKWRDANPHVEILDVGFKEITSDSLGTARRAYEFLGMPMTPKIELQIKNWDESNPQHKYGKASYSLEPFNLTVDQVREMFAPYIERFSDFL